MIVVCQEEKRRRYVSKGFQEQVLEHPKILTGEMEALTEPIAPGTSLEAKGLTTPERQRTNSRQLHAR